MARLGLDASRFAKGDPRDINHFHAIVGTRGATEAYVGMLSLYSDGTATVTEDVTGRILPFDSHDEARAYALAM